MVRVIAEQVGRNAGILATTLPEQIFTLGIERIVEKRLEHVPAEYRKVLEAAAALGRKVDSQVMQQMFPAFELPTFLMTCANCAILESSEGDWRFVHDKLREGLLARLDSQGRQQLHAEVAQALEFLYANHEAYSSLLAYHFKQAGAHEPASRYYLRAGDSATRLCAYSDARRHFSAALESLQLIAEDGQIKRRKVDTLLKQVQASHIADKPQQNLERLEQAASLLQSLAPAAESEPDTLRHAWMNYWFGRIHYYCDSMKKSLAHHEQVLKTAKERGLKELLVGVSSASGTALYAQGRVELALPRLDKAIATFAEMGHGYEWVRAVGHIGLCLIGIGQYERGLAELHRAHARALEIDKPIIISMTHLYYSVSCMHSGDWPTMLERAGKGLQAAKQCGEKIYQAIGFGFIAWAQNLLGQHDEALRNYESMQDLTREMGGQLLYGLRFAAAHAENLLYVGRLDEAIAQAKAVIAQSIADDSYNSWGIAERAFAMALHTSQPDANAEVDGHMQASLHAFFSGGLMLDVARTRLYWARVQKARGDLTQARQLLAQSILQFRAAGCDYALENAQALERTWD